MSRLTNVALPLLGVVAVVAGLAGIALYSYDSNRRDALALTAEALQALERRIEQEVEAYLDPADGGLRIMAGVLAATPPQDRDVVAERIATPLMQRAPQLSTFSYGKPDGSYLMLHRTASGAIDTKTITITGGERRVEWIRRAPDGTVLRREEDATDSFDPRERAWYVGAGSTGLSNFWTDVYVFFTDRIPGITVSRRVTLSGEDGVVGFDISLQTLSSFLAGLTIGHTGQAMIVDPDGRLVADPDPRASLKSANGDLRPARVDEVGDARLVGAWDRGRVLGQGQEVLELAGQRTIVVLHSLRHVTGRDWSLLILAPERDFVGFVAANNSRVLVLSLGVVALAILLALALVRQGVRADRAVRAAAAREEALAAQSLAFEALGRTLAAHPPGSGESLRAITALVARALGARRASLWLVEDNAAVLRCADAYDREQDGHTAGAEIRREEAPEFFAAALAGEELAAAEAASDPRLASVFGLYLERVGCRSLVSMPIRAQDGVGALLWVEDVAATETRHADATGFLRAVAAMLEGRLAEASAAKSAARRDTVAAAAGGGRAVAAVAPQIAMRTASVVVQRSRRFQEELARRGRSVAAEVFPDTTVLVLRFIDPAALAERASGGAAIEEVVRSLERIAAKRGIDYIKIMTDEVIVADGFGGHPTDTATNLAEAALDAQEHCRELFGTLGRRGAFAIGIDTGPVIGSAIGFGAGSYNIWGEAARIATAMARSAPAGAIQVTEATYRLLADRFLFQPRGRFWIETVGETQLYLLRGAL